MKQILALVLSLNFYGAKAQIRDSFLLNRILYKGYSVNGQKQGVWEGYSKGKLIEDITFFNNEKHGLTIHYDGNGKVLSVYSYSGGEQIGLSKVIKSNNEVDIILDHNKGKPNGLRILLDSLGNIRTKQIWPTPGLPHYFNATNDNVTDYIIDDSVFCCGEQFYANGKPKFLTNISFNEDTTFVSFKEYDRNGAVILKGQCKNICNCMDCCDWIATGKWVYYNRKGRTKIEEYYSNGNLKRQYYLDPASLRDSIDSEWYENGVQKELRTYRHGKQQGDHKTWNKSGQLLSYCRFCTDTFFEGCNCITFNDDNGSYDMLFPDSWYENGAKMNEFIKTENGYKYIKYLSDGKIAEESLWLKGFIEGFPEVYFYRFVK